MAVPSSGPLGLYADIWGGEIGGAQANTSLHGASVYAGFSTPDAMSDFYGWSDVEVPSVTTNGATSVTTTSMTANGNVTNTGNENPTRGFYFGTSTNYSSNTKYSVGIGGTGAFSRSMTGLSYATYYYWAYASNSAGEAVGGRITQVTTVPTFTPTYGGTGTGCKLISANYYSAQTRHSTAQYINPYTGAAVAYAGCGTPTNFPDNWNSMTEVTNARNRWTQGYCQATIASFGRACFKWFNRTSNTSPAIGMVGAIGSCTNSIQDQTVQEMS